LSGRGWVFPLIREAALWKYDLLMTKNRLLCRCLAALLCAALPLSASAGAAQVSVGAAAVQNPLSGAAAAGAIPRDFLQSLDRLLTRTETLLGSPLPQVPTLEASVLGGAPQTRLEASRAADAAELLSRAALATPVGAAAELPGAAAARVLVKSLADPAARARVVAALRVQGGAAAGLADRIESLGDGGPGAPLLAKLAEGLSSGLDAGMVGESLAMIFDGGAAASDASPEAFAATAERLFSAGRLSGDERAPVVYANRLAKAGTILPEGVPADDEIRGRMELSPLTNPERERVVVELFKKAGARAEDIQIQDLGRNRHNFLVVKKGRTDRVVVVGSHHDKVSVGAGTIDNWTGTTMVINLYQALKDVETDATYVFAVFGGEEEGLVGSREYVRGLDKAQRAKIDSMVNLDTLAVDGTFSWKNGSAKVLLDKIKKVALEALLKVEDMVLYGGDADSTPFNRIGIPAMSIFGASNAVIWDIIHSANDTMAAFSLPHYKNAYLLVLALLKKLDLEPVRPSAPARAAAWMAGAIRSAFPA